MELGAPAKTPLDHSYRPVIYEAIMHIIHDML